MTKQQEAQVIPFNPRKVRFVPLSQMVLRDGKIVGWLVCDCDDGSPTWPGHSDTCPIKEG